MISLLQLQYFQVLAEEQHLGRSSEKHYISQTTLSTMISKLERELGVRLFDRNGGSLRLNECGRKYLQYVNGALLMLADGERAAKALGGQGDNNTLSLAISGTNAWGETIIAFKQKYPKYRITQQSEVLPAMKDNLLSGRLDMALVGTRDMEDDRLECLPLREGRIYACLPRGHRLEDRQAVTLSDLKDEPIISTLKEMPYTVFCMDMFQKAGITPNIVTECDFLLRPRLLASGMGIVLLYGPALAQPIVAEMFRPFVCIPIEDECAVRRLGLFWRRGRRFTPVMAAFRAFLTDFVPHSGMSDQKQS